MKKFSNLKFKKLVFKTQILYLLDVDHNYVYYIAVKHKKYFKSLLIVDLKYKYNQWPKLVQEIENFSEDDIKFIYVIINKTYNEKLLKRINLSVISKIKRLKIKNNVKNFM